MDPAWGDLGGNIAWGISNIQKEEPGGYYVRLVDGEGSFILSTWVKFEFK